MQKKQTILVVASLLVVVLSVTLAYFTAQIIGKGKDVSVSSADLKIVFTDTDGNIEGNGITPGWSNSKTFTVKNESNGTYKYDIIIKDLVNTFVTNGYLQYKITSTDGGYNMTEFKDIPKSSASKDKVLAYSVSIPVGVTQSYTIEFKYANDENVDQSDDMGKKLSGTLFITEGTERPTLANQLLEDNPTISTRNDFSTPFTTNTVNTLYKAKEDNTDVYYFAGIDGIDAHCEVEGIKSINYEFLKFINGYSTDVSLSDTEAIDEDTCKTKSLCNLGFPTDKVIFGLTQAQCQELVKKHSFSHVYEESDYSEDLTNRTWVTEQIKPINNWVKFGKYQKDLIRYRGYKSTTDTSYKVYSTMDECTSASSYNTNCTEYKYANTGDDIYWRIIRTNSDGSVRLLYHGTSTTTTEAYIGTSAFNTTYNNPMYVGYMYGTSGSLVNNRANTNNSTIKGIIDTWYENNLKTNYTKYLSTTAVYCNDRSNPAGGYNTDKKTEFYYGGYTRLGTNKTPTYDCTNVNDKFTVDTSTGNGKLTYPIALMTADEVSFAGGVYFTYAETWYYKNSAKGSSTGLTLWWLLSPSYWNNGSAEVFLMSGSSGPGDLGSVYVFINTHGVRPVISLKSCVKTSGGDGSASDPYTIKETTSGC